MGVNGFGSGFFIKPIEMKPLSLQELQSFSLDILRDVHEFCLKNGIRYSLAYGTLLGAVRHKGFIPWDDDIDIVMPRPDYERFCQSFTSEKYLISNPRIDKKCCIPFARVFDDTKTSCFSRVPWNRKGSGVWIDVFPLDGVSCDLDSMKKKLSRIHFFLRLLNTHRYAIRPLSINEPFLMNAKTLLRKILTLNGFFANKYAVKIDLIVNNGLFDGCDRFVQLVCPDDGLQDQHQVSLFNDMVDMEFESQSFRAFSRYDEYLRQIYGDYMVLPPVDQRKPKQTYLYFYWK